MLPGSLFSCMNLVFPVVNTCMLFVLERRIPVSVLSGVFLAVLMIFICSLSLLLFFEGGGGYLLLAHLKKERWYLSYLCLFALREESHNSSFQKWNTVEKKLMMLLQKHPSSILLVHGES